MGALRTTQSPAVSKLAALSDHLPSAGRSTPAPSTPTYPFPYIIRPATQDDASGIVNAGRKVWVETFSHTTSADNIAEYLDGSYRPNLISEDIAEPNRRYLVARPREGQTK